LAELTGFAYQHGKSFLHRMDVRVKLLSLILISLACLNAAPPSLAALTGLMILAALHVRLPLSSILLEIRYFFFLLLVVFVAGSLSTPGSVVFEFLTFSVTLEGVRQGGLLCWRLVLVLLAGLDFVTTTRPSEIKAAVEWFLRPVPRIPEKRVATMLSLIIRFIPLILSQARETADAQRARCVDSRKNPAYRLIKFSIPMIRRTFSSADKLAVAMEARCYNENRTPHRLASSPADWLALLVVLGIVILTGCL